MRKDKKTYGKPSDYHMGKDRKTNGKPSDSYEKDQKNIVNHQIPMRKKENPW